MIEQCTVTDVLVYTIKLCCASVQLKFENPFYE